MNRVLYTLVLTSWFCSASFGAELPTSLTEYVRLYLKMSEKDQVSASELYLAGRLGQLGSQPYETQFSLAPSLGNSSSSIQATGFSSNVFGLNLDSELSQSLPTATTVAIGTSQKFGLSGTLKDSYRAQTIYGKLEQPLWQNAFGRQLRLESNRLTALHQKSKADRLETRAAVCHSGVETFLNAYTAENKFTVYKEIYESSVKTFKHLKTAFQQKLVSKSDWLGAQADRLQTEESYLEAKSSRGLAFYRMAVAVRSGEAGSVEASPVDLKVDDPFFEGLPVTSMSKEPPPSVKSAYHQVLAAEENVAIAKDKDSFELDITLEGGRNQAQVLSGAQYVTSVEDYVFAGLQLSWPIWNRSPKGTLEKSLHERNQAIKGHFSALKEARYKGERLFQDWQIKKKKLELSKKRVDLYRQQTQIALKLLKRGRKEFEEYLQVRDRYLGERVSYWDHFEGAHLAHSEWTAWHGKLPGVCQLGSNNT